MTPISRRRAFQLASAPGDRLQLELVNRPSKPTNLHTHGLYVSPGTAVDNVFLRVEPGASFDHDYQLPRDHPSGVCTGTTLTITAWSPIKCSAVFSARSSSVIRLRWTRLR